MANRLTGSKSRSVSPPPFVAAARELAVAVRDLGEDLEPVLRRARVDLPVNTLLDADADCPLTREAFARLYAEFTWTLDGHAARQEGRSPITKPQIDLFACCLITCADLSEVIARAATFSEMVAPRMAPLVLTVEGGTAVFRMSTLRTRRNLSALVSDLTGLSMYHRLFGWLIGHDIALSGVELRYPPLLTEATAAWLMPHPIAYNAADNLLRFPAAHLTQPVVRSYPELVRMLERFPFDLEEPQSLSGPFSERVRLLMSAGLAQGSAAPRTAELARQFEVSPATLKRRLAEEGASVRALHEGGLRALAFRMLEEGLAVGEVARRLGFSDAGSFTRAFRRWTGHSPSAWRARPTAT
jgi:AraC-like DNA-binding protein